jgi:hypothetical protein
LAAVFAQPAGQPRDFDLAIVPRRIVGFAFAAASGSSAGGAWRERDDARPDRLNEAALNR